MQLHCLNQISSRLWKFGPAYINELQQNLLRNKHAEYSHILCNSHILCTWIARKFSLIYHDKSHAFGFFFFEKTFIILLLQGYNGKQYFKCMTIFIRGTISHMTLVIFVVKLNISVSRISQIIFFLVAGLIILDVFLQIPVGYYFVQMIMKCLSATVHHLNFTFIVFIWLVHFSLNDQYLFYQTDPFIWSFGMFVRGEKSEVISVICHIVLFY